MGFLEICLEVFRNLISSLVSCFSNTSTHHYARDEGHTTGATSSSTPLRQNFEVFLSFRGKSTRRGFTDYLYHELKNRGIEVFRDNEELYVGENIDRLFEAIKVSKISIPIISPEYTSSIWCLKELLQILECRKMLGQLVLPIFYHVKPSDVREQKGDFGKNFQLCKREYNLDGKIVRELENAFKEITTVKGWESDEIANGHEGQLVRIVATRIFNELRKAVLVVPEYLVGVEEHVKEIKKMIDAKPNDAKIIGILGMGGIGKTTLAKVLYNTLCSDFECQSFVPNVREASKTKGMEVLQNRIISDILINKLQREISHVEEGITIIEQRFQGKKLLLLLDDIESNDQLNQLVPKNNCFGSESIVIITTRNKDVAVASTGTVNLSYQLNELNMDQSYELFCRHAFGRDAFCPNDLDSLARKIISTTGGLPLAVEIIGSLLYRKSRGFWKVTLEKLRRVPDEKVQEILKISYDYLAREQQQIFLDIACLSFDYELKYASYMWKSCDFFPEGGIEKLISLSLIKRDDGYNKIIMHDQLIDLGRIIVYREGCYNIEPCSRIWSRKEAIKVMERKQGTEKVQALILGGYEKELCYRSEDFEGMINLRFLRMSDVRLMGDFENRFPNLRWLDWGPVFPSPRSCVDLMGINFYPKNLVVLELFYSDITERWKGWRHMKDLKVIKLEGCIKLTTTPDFSAVEELEVLILNSCSGLKKIHPSIGKFKNTLKVLSIASCSDLQELPIELGKMEELRELNIGGTSIREIPIVQGYMTKLETLSALKCGSLLSIPDSLGSLVKLQRLNLKGCELVTKIPDSIGKLCNLEHLNISGCKSLQHLPDLSQCTKLKHLIAKGCAKLTEIRWLENLTSLEELDIRGCFALSNLPSLPGVKIRPINEEEGNSEQ